MSVLENEILKKDQEMKKVGSNVRKTIDSAVDLQGLSHKIFSKYMNYIQSQVNITIKERQSFVPLSQQRRGLAEPTYNDDDLRYRASNRDPMDDDNMMLEMGSVAGEEFFEKNKINQIEPASTKPQVSPDVNSV